MKTHQRIAIVAAVAALCGASASAIAAPRNADPYTDGARVTNKDGYIPDDAKQHQADPFTSDARVGDRRDPYTDGA